MTRPYLRSTVCCSMFGLLLAGCATDRSKISPSLMSKLKQDSPKIQQVSYQVDEGNALGSKKIGDPLTLKLRYARWMEELKNFPEARNHYGNVLSEQPENFEAIIGLARIDQVVGEKQKAEAGFVRALELRPDSAAALHAYGQFQLSQGRMGQAIPLLNQALLAQPNNKAYRYHLAVALARSGDVNAALPYFKQTIGEAAAHHNIATVLRDTGDLRGAEQHFRQAISLQPDLEQSRHALTALYNRRRSKQLPGTARGGAVVQGTPNQTIVPATHQTLTPTQREQLRNQKSLTR